MASAAIRRCRCHTFARACSGHTVVQGNLDPLLLVVGWRAALERRVAEILEACAACPFIFNLGHGIVPQTPPANVGRLVELVRSHGQDLVELWIKALYMSWLSSLGWLVCCTCHVLFVYHCDAEAGGRQSETFKIMEARLLRVIMGPAMLVAWASGLTSLRYSATSAWTDYWFLAKLVASF